MGNVRRIRHQIDDSRSIDESFHIISISCIANEQHSPRTPLQDLHTLLSSKKSLQHQFPNWNEKREKFTRFVAQYDEVRQHL